MKKQKVFLLRKKKTSFVKLRCLPTDYSEGSRQTNFFYQQSDASDAIATFDKVHSNSAVLLSHVSNTLIFHHLECYKKPFEKVLCIA